jgi:hypothetical protein
MNENFEDMMTLEILKKILGEDRIKVIAEDTLKRRIDWYLNDRRKLEDLICNITYETAFKYMDDTWNADLRNACEKRIRKAIEEDNFSYYMFKEGHSGEKIMDEEVESARPFIKEKIREIVDKQLTFHVDGQDIMEWMWEAVICKLFGQKAEEQAYRANHQEMFYQRDGE